MSIKKVVIIGLGEVGSSWFKVTSEGSNFDIIGIDLKGNKERRIEDKVKGETVLHVCTPFFDGFEEASSRYISEYSPDLVVVNTSSRVGTTRSIYELANVETVHIPVRGVHPDIDKGIKTFVNAIGPVNDLSAKLAGDYLDQLGITHETFHSPEETEMAKLLDTSYYGWNILFTKQVFDLCEEYGLDFNNVYTRFNQTYNEGYAKLDKANVIRPVLVPPQQFNKKLGVDNNHVNGHCVLTNLEILKTMKKSDKIRFIDYALDLDKQ